MLTQKLPKGRLIEEVYKKAEKAMQAGAAMPAFTLVFDDHTCFVLYVEKAGDSLILRLYEPEYKIYKPLFILGEFQCGPMEH
jgi:hypothetical protein